MRTAKTTAFILFALVGLFGSFYVYAQGERDAASIWIKTRQEDGHRIKFSDSSRIYADVVLNGRVSTKLLVDTGASRVLIPLEVARELGYVTGASAKIDTKLADGTARKGTPIMLRSVEIGDLKVKNVPAVAMDLRGGDGLLGMSFLSRFHMRIDSEKKELMLRPR